MKYKIRQKQKLRPAWHAVFLAGLLIVCTLLFPNPAFAYLDPGTGNILIYILVSILTSALYFAKNLWYNLRRRSTGTPAITAAKSGLEALVLFSEGKIYWSTFKSVIEALIERKYHFRYLSMDIEDPGLAIENEYMHARYIGTGSAAFARAANVHTKVMLQTTANIGTPGYPMPLPKHVECLAHIVHGVGGLGLYYKNAHDTCDALLLMGAEDWESVRLLEKKRGLKERECVSAGVPCFDELVQRITPKEGQSDPAIILIAPSWGEKNCLAYCGTAFIHYLLNGGYNIIIRPHPFSLKMEKEFIDSLIQEFSSFPQLTFDLAVDGSTSLAKADLMISDKSGVRFDFAFLYERPVITMDVPLLNQEHFEISELEYVWENDVETKLGPVIPPEQMQNLSEEAFLHLVNKALSITSSELGELRMRSVANIGSSGSFIANWAIEKCKTLQKTDSLEGEK